MSAEPVASESLAGRTCVVTGASSGIGAALAVALARRGARVWAAARRREPLEELARDSAILPGTVKPVVVDLEREDEIDAAARQILVETDGVDVLVHSAGSIAFGSFEELSTDDLDRQLRVNLRAPVLLTQRLLPAVRRAKGQIVFMNSLAAHRPSAHNAFYAATKRGLTAVADGLRDEVNTDGVRVVSIYTGRTATPMQVSTHRWEGRPYAPEWLLQPADVVDVVLSTLSLARSGEVTDVNVRPARKLPAT